MTEDCLNCRSGHPSSDAEGRIDFTKKVCKRMPPVALMVAGPRGEPMIGAFFPTVGKGVRCDEWKLREDLVPEGIKPS